MAANTDPIYSRTPDLQVGGAVLGPNANTALDGTGANISSIFQADTGEGGFVQKVILKAVGSPVATVARLFVHTTNGAFTPGTTNTAANTALIAEISLPAITVSQTLASNHYEIPVNIPIPAGYRLLLAFGTSTGAAGTGYAATVVGGKY
jgi:hypothetical protein